MTRRDHTLSFALTASLALHGGLLLVLAGRAEAMRPTAVSIAPPQTTTPQYVAPPDLPAPPPAELLFGDPKGAGDAGNAADGRQPMTGRRANEIQAFLSRDPKGPGAVGQDPSMSMLPRGDNAAASDASTSSPPVQVASSIGMPDTPKNWSAPKSPPPKPPAPKARDNTSASHKATPSKTNPGAPDPPADPAIQSDSESDPFASVNSVEFTDGRVDARFGRKVRTVRPRLSLAAQIDLFSVGYPKMRVRLRIDSSGNVRKVTILHSSGSHSADQEIEVALYQWWIEPKKDKSGHPIGDVIEFSIAWR